MFANSLASGPGQKRILVFAIMAMAGCSDGPAAPSTDGTPVPAQARAAGTSDMSVSSAVPDSATQDTTISVTINGSGFVPGTIATWAIGGLSDPVQVRTNSTTYVSSRKLIANITISETATVGQWDIIVAASGKKGGIGTEMFEIKLKPNGDYNSRANYVVEDFTNVSAPGSTPILVPSGLRGDGRLRDGTASTSNSEYQGGYCGSNGVIYNGLLTNTGTDDSGDLNIAPDGLHGGYCGEPRYYDFYFGGAGAAPTRAAAATRLFAIWALAVGSPQSRAAAFHVHLPECTQLVYDDAVTPSQSLRVTRLPDVESGSGTVRQWRIESQGTHMATCRIQKSLKRYVVGQSYYMPLSMVVTEVPWPFPTYP
jgi:hypothetical protein